MHPRAFEVLTTALFEDRTKFRASRPVYWALGFSGDHRAPSPRGNAGAILFVQRSTGENMKVCNLSIVIMVLIRSSPWSRMMAQIQTSHERKLEIALTKPIGSNIILVWFYTLEV
jgi:hypothetical protein